MLPNKAKKYLQALGLKSKNDKIDAKGLAQMGAEQNLKNGNLWANFFYDLRILTRQHEVLQKNITSEKNRLHAAKLLHVK
ncbi:MAG: transposase [Saprospiraceae bacterium]|nr:transposase [Saprospiraceae bacterium]